jgi:hypothetical protein
MQKWNVKARNDDYSALKGGLLLLLALVTWMNATTRDITCNNEGGPTTTQVVYGLRSPTRNCEQATVKRRILVSNTEGIK